jgi:hypothetical protein
LPIDQWSASLRKKWSMQQISVPYDDGLKTLGLFRIHE